MLHKKVFLNIIGWRSIAGNIVYTAVNYPKPLNNAEQNILTRLERSSLRRVDWPSINPLIKRKIESQEILVESKVFSIPDFESLTAYRKFHYDKDNPLFVRYKIWRQDFHRKYLSVVAYRMRVRTQQLNVQYLIPSGYAHPTPWDVEATVDSSLYQRFAYWISIYVRRNSHILYDVKWPVYNFLHGRETPTTGDYKTILEWGPTPVHSLYIRQSVCAWFYREVRKGKEEMLKYEQLFKTPDEKKWYSNMSLYEGLSRSEKLAMDKNLAQLKNKKANQAE